MSDNKLIATIKLYYNPISKQYSGELLEDGQVKESVSGSVEAISDWMFCMSLALDDIVEVGEFNVKPWWRGR